MVTKAKLLKITTTTILFSAKPLPQTESWSTKLELIFIWPQEGWFRNVRFFCSKYVDSITQKYFFSATRAGDAVPACKKVQKDKTCEGKIAKRPHQGVIRQKNSFFNFFLVQFMLKYSRSFFFHDFLYLENWIVFFPNKIYWFVSLFFWKKIGQVNKVDPLIEILFVGKP